MLERSKPDPERDAEINQQRCDERMRENDRNAAVLLSKVGLPRRHLDFVPDYSGQWGHAWSEVGGRLTKGSLVALVGPRGTGKTQMAVVTCKQSCDVQRSALYTTAMDIFVAIKASYKPDGDERSALAQFERPSLLVIDEAHVRGETEWENNLLTHLIDSRYRVVKDTIIISNQTHDKFRASIGPSIYSRLIETGGVLECDWPSFRKTGEQ